MKMLNTTTSQIEKVAATESGRFAMNNVLFHVERCHLVATNGHALAIVHVVPEEGDVTGWITPPALQFWRAALKAIPKYANKTQVHFTAGKDMITVTDHHGAIRQFPRPPFEEGKFPDYDAVFPKDVPDTPAFSIDIQLLYKLVEALGHVDLASGGRSNMVAVFPSKENKGAHLVKTSQDGPIGILMPVRFDDEKNKWLTSVKAVDKHFAKQLKTKREAEEKRKAAVDGAVAEAEAKSEPVPPPTPKQVEKFEGDIWETDDGVKFYQYESGSLGDHPEIDKADLIYDTLEQLKEVFTTASGAVGLHQVGVKRDNVSDIGEAKEATKSARKAKKHPKEQPKEATA